MSPIFRTFVRDSYNVRVLHIVWCSLLCTMFLTDSVRVLYSVRVMYFVRLICTVWFPYSLRVLYFVGVLYSVRVLYSIQVPCSVRVLNSIRVLYSVRLIFAVRVLYFVRVLYTPYEFFTPFEFYILVLVLYLRISVLCCTSSPHPPCSILWYIVSYSVRVSFSELVSILWTEFSNQYVFHNPYVFYTPYDVPILRTSSIFCMKFSMLYRVLYSARVL